MRGGGVKAVFCTYHSLNKVRDAQLDHNAPRFDLAIADEAHRTTGVANDQLSTKADFRIFHDAEKLYAVKRLYMTATPRVYSEQSIRAVQRAATKKGLSYNVVDMSDVSVYGPLLHHVKFSDAVEAGELSDYRVIVLGIREEHLTKGIRGALEGENVPKKVSQMELCRLLGTMLALNGAVEGQFLPGKLSRSIAFASTIQRSKWFTETVNDNIALKRRVSNAMSGGEKRADLESRHLDGNSTALKRNQERRWLNDAPNKNQARMICNVKVFSEGVDVPALEAVTFLDPKQSHIDIVQAVGRVMRKAPGKTNGYIIVPVFVPDGDGDIADLLEQRGDDYRHVGSVLRALQSHDERLAESPAKFVSVIISEIEKNPNGKDTPPEPGGDSEDDEPQIKDLFTFNAVEPGIFAHVVASSGLGNPGQVTADEIARSVRIAARRIEENNLQLDSIRQTLDLSDVADKEVSITAALILCNACMLHRRLQKESSMQEFLPDLLSVGRSKEPAAMLAVAWDRILEKDYHAIFRPALSIIEHSPSFSSLTDTIKTLSEGVASLSDTIAELGYDHAGPLYHKILGTATSDGAFYTNNISALMLAGLALRSDLVDWSDWQQATKLRILDPACGTGTLLMAALKTIKDRMSANQPEITRDMREAYKKLVENSIIGLDINYQATQLAASNLTLGAPSVEYDSMHIYTMKHGPQSDGGVKLGSLELLPEAVGNGRQPDLFGHIKQAAVSTPYSSISKEIHIREVDVVLMNPPFTNSDKRGTKFSKSVRKDMQDRESKIKHQIKFSDPDASVVCVSNSIETYFSPLADSLLHKETGVLGTVLPTTALTSTSVVARRKFLAERFHIHMIVTCHEPNRLNFSENTSIHESLLVCRRRNKDKDGKSTTFIALNHMPRNSAETADWLEAVSAGKEHKFHRTFEWPRSKIIEGDWTPAQYYDGSLAKLAQKVDNLRNLSPLGNVAMVEPIDAAVRMAFCNPLKNTEHHPSDGYEVVWTHKTSERETMRSFSDYTTEPKAEKYKYAVGVLWPKSSRLLIACRIRPQVVRVSSVFLPRPALGQAFIPVTPFPQNTNSTAVQLAWCAYLNSTPAVLSFLNRRQKTLTYALYSLDQLRNIPVPDPEKTDLTPLEQAFKDLGDKKFLPWSKMNDCPVRAKLDDVVAHVLDIDPEIVGEWRHRIVNEPTVSNRKPTE